MKDLIFISTKAVIILFLTISINSNSFAGTKIGKGEVIMSEKSVDWFIKYIRAKKNYKPMAFILSSNGQWSTYWYCPYGSCRSANYMPTIRKCEEETGVECGLFARRYTVIWKNETKPKKTIIRMKWSDQEIRDALKEWGFYGVQKNSNTESSSKSSTPKTTKKYEAKGERSIALSWEGYEDLIAGKINFNEKDYKGTLRLSLPNNDGECEGSYILQTNGTGTWQLSCSNNMGAAGTLKWIPDKSVTGIGRDYNDKKVKFTVSGKG